MNTITKKLGIIAGKGVLPSSIANLYLKQFGSIASGKDLVCIAAIDKDTDVSLIAQYNYRQFSIGSVGEILEYFTQNNAQEIIIIGGITRPEIKSIKADFVGSMLLTKILKEKFLGDDNVLKVISDFIESKGFKVISPKELLKHNNYQECYPSLISPSKHDKTDIDLGQKVLHQLGELDIGQSVVICDGYVLGIEAAEGTDNLIRRCELLRKSEKGGVLVKMSKSGQDLRFDLPTIGPDTIFYLAKHGYRGIAIEKSGVIIARPEETIELINENKLFIVYF